LTTTLEPPPTRTSAPSLVAELLREQQELTAVERFAQAHEEARAPLQADYYRALLPASPPQPGEQYAFEVNLDLCSGCKACVTACHALNGLDETETWRDVGLLVGGTSALPVLQHVTAACHHCLEPACMNVCPTRAYEKDPHTGIVKHLDDQCFGCQYCILACPYDVPKYNPARGIVRKCDLCSTRLQAGAAPACVQACPHEAIRITVVQQAEVAADCEANPFLPGAPDPQFTQPTTNYKTSRVFPRNMLPADYYSVHAEHAHAPLIVMLVLTQLSVGAFFAEQFLQGGVVDAARPYQAVTALLLGVIALAAAVLHLGRPHLAFRAMLGLKSSWLSREILAFGLFATLAATYAAALWFGENVSGTFGSVPDTLSLLGQSVVVIGLIAVFCSAMIYHAVPRPFWNGPRTLLKFFGTTVWLGCAAALMVSCVVAAFSPAITLSDVIAGPATNLCRTMLLAAVGKLGYEAALFLHLLERQVTPLKRSALLLVNDLAAVAIARFACGVLGGVLLPALLLQSATALSPAALLATVLLAAGFSVTGELLERYLYFTAAVAPRMPGGLKT
jgi:Fe-S-cluster-containing dehydrogenase component/DMSO reductase anchor subunit